MMHLVGDIQLYALVKLEFILFKVKALLDTYRLQYGM